MPAPLPPAASNAEVREHEASRKQTHIPSYQQINCVDNIIRCVTINMTFFFLRHSVLVIILTPAFPVGLRTFLVGNQIFRELYRSSPQAEEWISFLGYLFFLILYLRRWQACRSHWHSSGEFRWYKPAHSTWLSILLLLGWKSAMFPSYKLVLLLAFVFSHFSAVVVETEVSVSPPTPAVVGAPLTDITMSTKAMSVVSVTSQCSYSSTIVHVPQPESGI